MRILVTGASGFIGNALIPMLEARGHEVHKMLRYVSGGRYDSYERNPLSHFADLRDRETVRLVVKEVKPEVIIHLAAEAAVSYSFRNPIDVLETNFMGTVNLGEAAREQGIEHYILASSSEVYGKAEVFPVAEDTILRGTSPYAVSKIAAEHYLWLLWDLYRFPVTVLRPFNSYGRALVGNRHYVVERAITQALTEGHIHLHDPRPARDFLFREDHARAYVHVVENREKALGQAINIGTGQSWTIAEMADAVASRARLYRDGPVGVSFSEVSDRPLDIPCLQGSNARARELLGWEPKWGFEEGLYKAIHEWADYLKIPFKGGTC